MSGALALERYIRDVPDFPIPGILYRDITPLLADAGALRQAVESMSVPWQGRGVDLVASMEARGFIFGAGIALELGAGFVPVRKPGKLPSRTREVRYSLEYGTDVLHMHEDAVAAGQKVLVVDDLVTGALAVLDGPDPRPINIGAQDEVTMLELAEIIKRLAGSSSEIVFRPLPEDDPRQRRPDTTRAREVLGWEPTVSMEDGLARTLEYFKTALSVRR